MKKRSKPTTAPRTSTAMDEIRSRYTSWSSVQMRNHFRRQFGLDLDLVIVFYDKVQERENREHEARGGGTLMH